ncbi:MAG: thiamine ABC transporter substrate-binding protein [Dehalococcoidia bacterium]
MRVLSFLMAVIVASMLVACSDDGGDETTATPTSGAPTGEATETATSTPSQAGETRELVLLTHDSFDARDDVIAAFEAQNNATVTILKGGDANEVVNRAILNAGNPEGDLLFGADNLTYERAVEAGVFEAYAAAGRDALVPDALTAIGDSDLVTPIDYGFVDLNLDLGAGLEPPATFEDLTTEAYNGTLVVEDPSTSSPGLQFLASTVAYFGEDGDYTWRDFWADLRANDVLVSDGWTDAYYTQFSLAGGDRPLVVSYTTSPAAEVFFGELEEPPTANVVPGPLFRQVEVAGVLAGANEPELARAFIDFMLTEEFQTQIPETMFVYPALPGTTPPEWWRWAELEVEPAAIEATQDDIDRWVSEWTETMRR